MANFLIWFLTTADKARLSDQVTDGLGSTPHPEYSTSCLACPGCSYVQFLQLHSLSPCRKRQTWPNWKANNKWQRIHWPVRWCAQQFASGVNKWSLQIAPRLTTTESSSPSTPTPHPTFPLSSSYYASLGISVAVSLHSFWDITNAKLCPHYSKTEWLSVCECESVYVCVCAPGLRRYARVQVMASVKVISFRKSCRRLHRLLPLPLLCRRLSAAAAEGQRERWRQHLHWVVVRLAASSPASPASQPRRVSSCQPV